MTQPPAPYPSPEVLRPAHQPPGDGHPRYLVLDTSAVRQIIAGLLQAAVRPVTTREMAMALLTNFDLDPLDDLQVRIMAKRVGICLLVESRGGRLRAVADGWMLTQ